MKKYVLILALGILLPFLFSSFISGDGKSPSNNDYVLIGWNDLGMHCSNKDFSNMSILPPYNNQYAHLILKGTSSSMPTVISQGNGYYVTYEIPGNTWSGSATVTSKTNFWVYAQHLFNVVLPPDVGLTGFGLTGTMIDSLNYNYAPGIPLTPYQDSDLINYDAFQLTLLKAYNSAGDLLSTTQTVIPVSNEISCVSSGCHSSETSILNQHEQVPGYNINNKPILCAQCHSDNALGMPGTSGTPPFSQAIHQTHGEHTNDCYKCHPGPNTQCFRDVMHTGGMVCQDCHGSVSNVGNTIENGRQPWLQEPSCGASSCHGSNYAEEPGKLFRQSHGHGGLYCSTCHGSPHAILPSENDRDNLQNVTLQGFSGTLKKCEVCHGYVPASPGPHGYNPLGIKPVNSLVPSGDRLLPNYPNPSSYMTNIPYLIKSEGFVTLCIIDANGKKIKTLMSNVLKPGEYKAEFYTYGLPDGVYYCQLNVNGNNDLRKIVAIH